ncbi:SirB2 family protein [Paraburkholderia sp. MM5384-R2]|uniref:SirB2 family protein n=1 Tax=Paraburkholderia sp. MM5384-R2 TaxID=2723097 RepID=UPI00161D9582|nr:SirB2 family protein [Paraburkholderia sp. MM5384-R2]MBB5503298.1 putative membrane protein SirB2 [Paraburkholderia sp. MM5384-R2]
MPLIDFYPALKFSHVSLVSCSGALFAVRGAAVLTDRVWLMRTHWRVLSYVIDSLLLAAGVTLWLMLRLNPTRDVWLGAKLLLLMLYIAVGSLAMKRGRTLVARGAFYGCAISVYLLIASIAVTHNPLGLLGR